MRNLRRRRKVTGKKMLAAITAFALALLSLCVISCGSESTEEAGGEAARPLTQEENAQSLGRIMGHRNQLEGELDEPVDVVISGDIMSMADAGEESWLLIRVVAFRPMSVPQEALQAAPGSELVVRLRKTGEDGTLSAGDSVEINARVSKSLEGPVIIGRAYRVIR